MEIVNLWVIEKFKRQYASSRKPLEEWINKTIQASWESPNDIKRLFASASFVKQFVIFNIGGNKYRLLTIVVYEIKRVRILKVGTHEEYGRWNL